MEVSVGQEALCAHLAAQTLPEPRAHFLSLLLRRVKTLKLHLGSPGSPEALCL